MTLYDTIRHFTDLNAWKINHQLVLEIYKITKTFPKKERFGLTNQIRRSTSSITANISEGFGRFYYKEKVRFYLMARGSSTETQNHLILAKDLSYIDKENYDRLKLISYDGYRLLCGLIRSTNNPHNG